MSRRSSVADALTTEQAARIAAPRRPYRRVTDEDIALMRTYRAAGLSDSDIARALNRHRALVGSLIGRVAKRTAPPQSCKPGVPVSLGERGQVLERDTVRTVWNDYALPPGHSATWGCLSSEPFPAGL